MALRTWWDGLPDERYWMEITGRSDTGENLVAPQHNGSGGNQWSYEAVSLVRPGDIVLHYQTNEPGGPALVGWSEVVGDVSTGSITWQARGSRGRERGVATTGPSWYAPLGGLVRFPAPVRVRELGSRAEDLLAMRRRMESEWGKPVYFPFYQYRPGELRPQQGYLTKFPKELIDLLQLELPGAGAGQGGGAEIEEQTQPRRRRVPPGSTTRIQDPVLRAAVERRSVDVAKAYYADRGAVEIVELGKPYDLRLSLDGRERHVEVKGSTLEVTTVELTANEVSHAEAFQPTDLVVVDRIDWMRKADGSVETSGGRMRIWSDWGPEGSNLVARTFAYLLPDA